MWFLLLHPHRSMYIQFHQTQTNWESWWNFERTQFDILSVCVEIAHFLHFRHDDRRWRYDASDHFVRVFGTNEILSIHHDPQKRYSSQHRRDTKNKITRTLSCTKSLAIVSSNTKWAQQHSELRELHAGSVSTCFWNSSSCSWYVAAETRMRLKWAEERNDKHWHAQNARGVC